MEKWELFNHRKPEIHCNLKSLKCYEFLKVSQPEQLNFGTMAHHGLWMIEFDVWASAEPKGMHGFNRRNREL